jgi:hypothetical protein
MVMPLIPSAVPAVLVNVSVRVLTWFIFTRTKSRLAGTSFTVPTGMVMVAAADLVASFAEVAVSVTFGPEGRSPRPDQTKI